MSSLRWRKVFRDLWNNKVRSLLATVSIMVGIFAVGMIAGAHHILTRDLNASYSAVNPANATILTEPFDDELVEVIEGIPNVRAATGRYSLGVRAQIGPDQWQNLQLIALPDFNNIQINKVAPMEGAWPPSSQEVVIERGGLGSLNTSLGNMVSIRMPNGRQYRLRFSGVAYDPTQSPPLFSGTAVGYISFDTLEWLGESREYNELQLLVAGDATDQSVVKQVAMRASAKVEKSGRKVNSVVILVANKHPLGDIVQAVIIVLSVLGLMALVLSGLLIANTLGALLTQETRQIGVMKAIGGGTLQIISIYTRIVLMFSSAALVVGIPLGALGAFALSRFVAGLINFDLTTLSIPLNVLLLEVAVGVLTPLIAGSIPIIKGTRITIREAIASTGLNNSSFGAGLIDRLIERLRGLPRPLMLSLRNTMRRKVRLLLALIALSMAGAIFIAILSVRESMLATLAEALTYDNYNVGIDFNNPYRVVQLEHEAKRFPGVKRVESWSFGGARRLFDDGTESENMFIYGIPAETTMIQPILLQGRWLLPTDQNAVVINTEVVKNQPDIAVDKVITIKIAGREETMKVVGVVKAVMAPRAIYLNYPYYARITGTTGQASAIRVELEQTDSASEGRMKQAMERHFGAIKLGVKSAQTRSDRREGNESRFNLVIGFLLIMALLLSLVGGLGLMGMMSINVIERTREIGVMRAIGASSWAVIGVALSEGIFVGLISWPFSVLLAMPLSRLLSDALGSVIANAPFNYTFSVISTFLWLGIVILLAAVASFLPAWNASRITVRNALAYE